MNNLTDELFERLTKDCFKTFKPKELNDIIHTKFTLSECFNMLNGNLRFDHFEWQEES